MAWHLFAIILEKLVTRADARVPNLMFTFCSHCVRFVRFLFALGAYFVLTLCSLGAYFVLAMALTGLLAAQAPLLQVNGSAPKTSNKHRKTNGTCCLPLSTKA